MCREEETEVRERDGASVETKRLSQQEVEISSIGGRSGPLRKQDICPS